MTIKFKISLVMMIGLICLVALIGNSAEIIHPLLNFFIYSIPSNTAISVFPHEPILIYLGKSYDPVILAIIGTMGTIVAGLLDYLVFVPLFSLKSLDFMQRSKGYRRAKKWFNVQPFLTLLIAGFSPIPFFPLKILAFASQYPLLRYIGSLVAGRMPRYYLLALFGEFFQVPDWLLISLVLIMFVCLLPKMAQAVSYWVKNKNLNSDKAPEGRRQYEI